MNSSTNSKKTHSSSTEVLRLEKYGMVVQLYQTIHTVPKWDLVYRNRMNERLTKEQAVVLAKDQQVINVDWEATDEFEDHVETTRARIYDKDMEAGAPLIVCGVADGPIMGVHLASDSVGLNGITSQFIRLRDPCHVVFDGTGKINYIPIFGVERELSLATSAIKTITPAIEVLADGYLGFAIQNQMFKFALRPKVPFHQSVELEIKG